MTRNSSSSDLVFRPVDAASRADFEALFASPGAPKHCWCMVWRRTAAEAKDNDGAGRKRQMMARIAAGTPVGLIAYEAGKPLAWVSVAPRETYRNLGGPAAMPGEVIWSIVCFWVPRKRRGEGMVYRLIAAAVEHAATPARRWWKPIPSRRTRRVTASWASCRRSRRPVSPRSAAPESAAASCG